MPAAMLPTMMRVRRQPPKLRLLLGRWYVGGTPKGWGTPKLGCMGGGMSVGVTPPRNSLGVSGPSCAGALNGPSPMGVDRGPLPGIGVERPGWGPDWNGGWYDMAQFLPTAGPVS